jgi:hypothetical protein
MTMRLRNAFVAICLICMPALAAREARSDSYRPDITVGPAISTLGIGGEIGVRFNDYIGLRIAGNAYSTSFDADYGDVRYDIDFNLASVGPMVDIYPFGRILKFTAGFRYNLNNADLSVTPTSNITFGGTTFTPAEVGTVDGEVDLNDFAPYVGLGLEATFIGDTLALGIEGGVLFQGSPSVSLKGNGTLANDPTFNAELRQEENEIEDDLSALAYYPVIRLYATFRF